MTVPEPRPCPHCDLHPKGCAQCICLTDCLNPTCAAAAPAPRPEVPTFHRPAVALADLTPPDPEET